MKSFKKGDTIQVWDYLAKGEDRTDALRGHGQVGVIIRKSRKTDISDSGERLRERAKNCYLVALPGRGLVTIHKEWLRYPREQEK